MQISDIRENTIKRAESFLNQLNKDDTIYLVGSNKYGLSLANFLSKNKILIKGFLNDFCDELDYCNFKIFKSNSIKSSDTIINCVVEGRTVDVKNHIKSLNVKSICDYFALQLAYQNELLEIDFLDDTESILEKKIEYNNIYNLLYDEQSKVEFELLTNFRLNRDINYLTNFKFRLSEQYFENFINFKNVFSFIDGGSYDGITTEEFIKKQNLYGKVYVFEPNLYSFNKVFNKFKDNSKVELYNKGLWNKDETLFFDSSLGSASKIDSTGIDKIEATSLDSLVEDKIDYIKLDIEGAELKALEGSYNLIKKYKPILAICVYHNQNDFIKVPKLINSIRTDYKIYLRHYTQGVFETVMYFI